MSGGECCFGCACGRALIESGRAYMPPHQALLNLKVVLYTFLRLILDKSVNFIILKTHIKIADNPYTCSKRYFACSTFDTMTGLLHLTELLMCFCKAPVSHALVFSCLVCIPVRVVLTISRYVFQW